MIKFNACCPKKISEFNSSKKRIWFEAEQWCINLRKGQIRIWSNSTQVVIQIWIHALTSNVFNLKTCNNASTLALSWHQGLKNKIRTDKGSIKSSAYCPKNIWIQLFQEMYLIWRCAIMHHFKWRVASQHESEIWNS